MRDADAGCTPQEAATAGSKTGARSRFWTLTLGSIGVVYGDIGTSPLYALKESLLAARGDGALTREMILGVVSLMLWTLVVIVTLKYVMLIMRMDNDGEGGTLSLMALVQRVMRRHIWIITLLGMSGAALFYGDAIITPAISVLSAVEGLELLAPGFDMFVVPLSLVILIVLFLVQSRGTSAVAAWFGPVTSVWFVALALGGAAQIVRDPGILAALSPTYGVHFLLGHGMAGVAALGAVFLTVTGSEALYADMGHFGRKPIQFAWSVFVLPSLTLNYLGQGALLLTQPGKLENPFYLLYPAWALLPMVVLASMATIIASQAVITGAFSLTQQAMQLGLIPRFEIIRTSETEKGQIYIPRINLFMLVAVIYVVGVFRSSNALASAYGIAVTGTMVVTAILGFFVLWRCWRWSVVSSALLIAPFLLVDLVFLGANMLKVMNGGWLPLAVGALVLLVMVTWRKGSLIMAAKAQKEELGLSQFLALMEKNPPDVVGGTAVFLTGNPTKVPSALLHNLKHVKVLHEHNVIMNVVTDETPRVDEEARVSFERLSDRFARVTLHFGFMETPNIAKALPACRALGWEFDIMQTSFFLSRRTLKSAKASLLPRWQERLFILIARRASDASQHFSLPTSRIVEVGAQVSI
ncbi:MAG: potassium transporter Kup [Rhizobiaceae bacterium]